MWRHEARLAQLRNTGRKVRRAPGSDPLLVGYLQWPDDKLGKARRQTLDQLTRLSEIIGGIRTNRVCHGSGARGGAGRRVVLHDIDEPDQIAIRYIEKYERVFVAVEFGDSMPQQLNSELRHPLLIPSGAVPGLGPGTGTRGPGPGPSARVEIRRWDHTQVIVTAGLAMLHDCGEGT